MDNLTINTPVIQQPTPCLSIMLKMFLEHTTKSADYMKDVFINYLLHTKVDIKIVYFMQEMIIPSMYLIVLSIGFLFSIAVIPLLFCLRPFTRAINAVKHQCSFCVESFLLVMFCNCLLIGTSLYIKIGNQIYVAVREYPQLTHNMIGNIQMSINDYKVQVQRANENSNLMRNSIIDRVDFIPINTTEILHKEFNPELDLIRNDLNSSLHLIQNEDILKKYDPLLWNKFRKFVLVFLKNNGEEWKTEVDHKFNKTNNDDLIKSINEDLKRVYYYFENFLGNFERDFSKLTAEGLRKSLSYIPSIKIIGKPVNNVMTALSKINDTFTKLNTKAIKFDSYVQSFIFTSFPCKLKVNLLRLILLTPSFVTVLFIIMIAAGSLLGLQELQTLINQPNSNIASNSIRLFQIAAVFAAVFLWILFALVILFYILFWPIFGICKSVKDGSLVANYFDNTSNWNNDTWLGFTFNHSYEFHNIKLQCVLNACKNNNTLMDVINLKEEPTQFYIKNKTILNIPELKILFNKVLNGSGILVESQQFDIILEKIKEMSRRNAIQKFPSNLTQTIYELIGYSPAYKDFKQIFKKFLVPLKQQYKLSYLKKKMNLAQRLSENMKDKISLLSIKNNSVYNFFDDLEETINRNKNETHVYTLYMLQNEIGKCSSFSDSYEILKVIICDRLLLMLLSLILSLTLMAFSLLFCFITTWRLIRYIQGTFDFYKYIKHTDRRYSEEKAKIIQETILIHKDEE